MAHAPDELKVINRVHLYIRTGESDDRSTFFCLTSLDQFCNMTVFTIRPNEEHLLVDHKILDGPPTRLAYKVKLLAGPSKMIKPGTSLFQLFNETRLHVQQIEWTSTMGKVL